MTIHKKGVAEAKKAKAAMESAVKVALAAVVGAVQGAMGKIGECLAGVVENQKGNVESQTNSNKSGEKSLLDSNNISDPLNLYSNKPWRNVDSNIKLPDNECYIGPANENALPIVSDELTMTEYDPYMKDFKDGMYVQNRAPDNRYYLGTITYNSDLNMAIYKPTDKKGFEQAKLEQDKKDIRTIASFAADWTPADVAIDSASFIAGHDIITGEECNRGILAAGILLPGGLDSLGKGLAKKGVKQASKHGDDVAEEAFKIGDDVTKGAGKAKWWHPGYVDELTDSQILLGVKQSPKGLSTLGSATRSEALSAGEAWAGNGAEKIIDKATGEVVGFKSTDGMRAFRIQYKSKEGMFRANFQQNEMVRTQYNINPDLGWGKKELSNVHIDILD